MDAVSICLKLDDVVIEGSVLARGSSLADRPRDASRLRVPVVSVQLLNTAVALAAAFDASRFSLVCDAEVAASWFEMSTLEERVALQPVPASAAAKWRRSASLRPATGPSATGPSATGPSVVLEEIRVALGQIITLVSAPLLRQVTCLYLAHDAVLQAADHSLASIPPPWSLLIRNTTSADLNLRQVGTSQCLHLPPRAEVAYIWGSVQQPLQLELQLGAAGPWATVAAPATRGGPPLPDGLADASAPPFHTVRLVSPAHTAYDCHVRFSTADGLARRMDICGAFKLVNRLSHANIFFRWALDDQGLPGPWSGDVPLGAATDETVLLPQGTDSPHVHVNLALSGTGDASGLEEPTQRLKYGRVALVSGARGLQQQYFFPCDSAGQAWVALLSSGDAATGANSVSLCLDPVVNIHNALDRPLRAVAVVEEDAQSGSPDAVVVLVEIDGDTYVVNAQEQGRAVTAAPAMVERSVVGAAATCGLLGLWRGKQAPLLWNQGAARAASPASDAPRSDKWVFHMTASPRGPWTLHVAPRVELLSQLPFDVELGTTEEEPAQRTEEGPGAQRLPLDDGPRAEPSPLLLAQGQRCHGSRLPLHWRRRQGAAPGAWHAFPRHPTEVDACSAMLDPSHSVVVQRQALQLPIAGVVRLVLRPSLVIENRLGEDLTVTWPTADAMQMRVAAGTTRAFCPARVLDVLRGHCAFELACGEAPGTAIQFPQNDHTEHAAAEGALRCGDRASFALAVRATLETQNASSLLVLGHCVSPPLCIENLTPHTLCCRLVPVAGHLGDAGDASSAVLQQGAAALEKHLAGWPHRRALPASVVAIASHSTAVLPHLLPASTGRGAAAESMGQRTGQGWTLLLVPAKDGQGDDFGPQVLQADAVDAAVLAMPLRMGCKRVEVAQVYRDGHVCVTIGSSNATLDLPAAAAQRGQALSATLTVQALAVSLVHACGDASSLGAALLGPWQPHRPEREIARLTLERVDVDMVASDVGASTLALRLGRCVLENRLASVSHASASSAETPQTRFEFATLAECPSARQMGRRRGAAEATESTALKLQCTWDPPTSQGVLVVRSAQLAMADWRLCCEDRLLGLGTELGQLATGALGPLLAAGRRVARDNAPDARTVGRAAPMLVVEELRISPLQAVLSIHAEVVMFLSVDDGRLGIGELVLSRRCFLNGSHLAEDLVSHYASEVVINAGRWKRREWGGGVEAPSRALLLLFFSCASFSFTFSFFPSTLGLTYAGPCLRLPGWLLTSLGLIGSPASLINHVTDGVRAFVYHATDRSAGENGTLGRVQRLGTGTQLLAQHMASGTLGTVVTMAKNFGRNVERLSLDTEHRASREEARRRSAQGVRAGFVEGLQGRRRGREKERVERDAVAFGRAVPTRLCHAMACHGMPPLRFDATDV